MYKTQEQIDLDKNKEFIDKLNLLGGYIKLDKPIRFRLTPHSPTIKIYELNINDNFKNYGEARDAILQTLRLITYEKNN